MTHPFDQLEKYCDRHGQKVIVSRDTAAGATVVTLECPECEKEMTEPTEETKVLLTLLRHYRHLAVLLRDMSRDLERRADLHDLSVLEIDEFAGRVEIQHIARTYPYDSPEYRASLKDNNSLQLHYSQNSHHPEHHPNGVNDMDLLDFIEMVCDWKAASLTYRNTSFEDGLKGQIERFKLQPEHLYLIRLIAGWLAQ